MKKIVVAILTMLVCLSFCSCTSFEKHGIEKYSPANSDVEITVFLPEDDFLTEYEYIEGDYHFYRYEEILFAPELERTILYLKYDDNTYQDAKKCVMENDYLSDNSVEEYNGYVFYNVDYNDRGYHPWEFRRFAYKDANNTLLFIGFYECADYPNVSDFNDWGAFLEEYYGEWYDFSQ